LPLVWTPTAVRFTVLHGCIYGLHTCPLVYRNTTPYTVAAHMDCAYLLPLFVAITQLRATRSARPTYRALQFAFTNTALPFIHGYLYGSYIAVTYVTVDTLPAASLCGCTPLPLLPHNAVARCRAHTHTRTVAGYYAVLPCSLVPCRLRTGCYGSCRAHAAPRLRLDPFTPLPHGLDCVWLGSAVALVTRVRGWLVSTHTRGCRFYGLRLPRAATDCLPLVYAGCHCLAVGLRCTHIPVRL